MLAKIMPLTLRNELADTKDGYIANSVERHPTHWTPQHYCDYIHGMVTLVCGLWNATGLLLWAGLRRGKPEAGHDQR
jgi:hypothetical protein